MTTDGLMLALMALSTGEQVRPAADGESLELTVENGAVPLTREAFDELEARQLVELTEAGVVVTDRGRWQLKKFYDRVGVRVTSRTRIAATVTGAK